MERLIPILVIFFLWSIIGSKGKKNKTGTTPPARRTGPAQGSESAPKPGAAGTKPDGNAAAARPGARRENRSSYPAILQRVQEEAAGLLGLEETAPVGGVSAPKTGSLQDAAAGMNPGPMAGGQGTARPGSLSVDEPEGTDPCHDDYANMRPGSLAWESAEGTDPCHDDWEPLGAENAPRRAPSGAGEGLGLSWEGNEIVKGFVYGEILKRRTGA